MEEKTAKRPRRVMVSEGKLLIMTELPFREGDHALTSLRLIMARQQHLP